jgi:hypothetical protein
VSDDAAGMLLTIFRQTQKIVDEGKDVNRTIVSNLINIVSNEVLTAIGQILKFADKARYRSIRRLLAFVLLHRHHHGDQRPRPRRLARRRRTIRRLDRHVR